MSDHLVPLGCKDLLECRAQLVPSAHRVYKEWLDLPELRVLLGLQANRVFKERQVPIVVVLGMGVVVVVVVQ